MRIESQGGSADIDDRGAYLEGLRLGGRDILMRTPDMRQTHGGACNLIPYAGRIRGGQYSFNGEDYEFAREKDGNSIHGFAREAEFTCSKTSDSVAECRSMLNDRGYPSALDTLVRYSISGNSLRIDYRIRNAGAEACPLVVGSHPYFLVEGGWRLETGGKARRLSMEDTFFPDGKFEGFDFDADLSSMELDTCFFGGGRLRLKSASGAIKIERENMDFFLIYNGKYTKGVSVAVEPMTGAPDAFHNGMGLKVLDAGETFSCGYSITAGKE